MASDTIDTNSTIHIISQTINFECYEGTNDYKGGAGVTGSTRFMGVATIDLPELKYRTQELTGTGVTGAVKMPARNSLESMTVTLHWRSMTAWAARLTEQRAHDIALYGAVNRYDSIKGTMGVLPVKIEFRGLPLTTTTGKFAPNEFMDSATEFEVTMLRITIDGAIEFQMSKFHGTFEVHGVNYVNDLGAALGF